MLNLTPNEVPSTGTSSTPLLPAGVYPGVISLIADLGQQRDVKFDSQKKSADDLTDADYEQAHQLWFSFALPTERYEVEYDDETVLRDQVIGKMYKVSNSEKANLIKMYQAVVTDGRNFGEMIGMPVTVTTGMTSGNKPKVTGIAAPMRGMTVTDPVREPLLVTQNDWEGVDDLEIPEFIKDLIKNRVQ